MPLFIVEPACRSPSSTLRSKTWFYLQIGYSAEPSSRGSSLRTRQARAVLEADGFDVVGEAGDGESAWSRRRDSTPSWSFSTPTSRP
jgi:hypothetical protein